MHSNFTMKRFSTMFPLLLVISNTFAAETTEASKALLENPTGYPNLNFYIALAFIIGVLVLVIVVVAYISRVLRIFGLHVHDAKEQPKNKALIFLPLWWKGLIYATVSGSIVTLISFLYISFSYVGSAAIAQQDDPVKIVQVSAQSTEVSGSNKVKEALVFTRDSVQSIGRGKALFEKYNCGSCHRNDGGGNAIGPNLTDEYWLHGGDINDVVTTIKDGVQAKGMPVWGGLLSPNDLKDISFFVLSLQGTNPVDAKEPQGEKN
jgi:mono/diheme cytochrome c family protein